MTATYSASDPQAPRIRCRLAKPQLPPKAQRVLVAAVGYPVGTVLQAWCLGLKASQEWQVLEVTLESQGTQADQVKMVLQEL